MRAQLTKLGKLALDFFLPQSCIGCGREGKVLCTACAARLPRISPPFCRRCGLPVSRDPCPDCARQELSFEGLRAPFRFERLVREAIHQFKYQNLRCLAAPLAGELAGYLRKNPLTVDIIMPVPLHPKRLRERGYNQSELIALELGHMLGLKVDCLSLKRVLDTKPQARMSKVAQRRHNMAGAFQCEPGGVGGQKVLLIDDVATSGATINNCAFSLKRTGAASVWGLTIAREV